MDSLPLMYNITEIDVNSFINLPPLVGKLIKVEYFEPVNRQIVG